MSTKDEQITADDSPVDQHEDPAPVEMEGEAKTEMSEESVSPPVDETETPVTEAPDENPDAGPGGRGF
jgi:hypothetical protein